MTQVLNRYCQLPRHTHSVNTNNALLDPTTKELNLSNKYNLPEKHFRQIAEKYPLLTNLNLGYCSQLSLGTFQKLAEGCKYLQTLDLRGCYQLGPSEFKIIGASFPLLRNLNLSYCAYLTDSSLSYIHSDHLEEISLDYCLRVSDEAIVALALRCKNLKRISLQGCTQLTDKSLVGLSMYIPQMEAVNLQECSGITDGAIEALASRCRMHLKWLSLVQCEQLKNKSIGAIGYYCKNLEVLLLSQTGFTPGSIPYIAKNLPRLRELGLEACHRLTSQSLQALANIKTLENLNLSFLPPLQFSTVAGLLMALPKLRQLQLFGNDFSAHDVSRLRQRFTATKIDHF